MIDKTTQTCLACYNTAYERRLIALVGKCLHNIGFTGAVSIVRFALLTIKRAHTGECSTQEIPSAAQSREERVCTCTAHP